MAKYRVLEKSFIGDALRNEGDEVDYDGEPSSNLELIPEAEAEGKAKAKGKGKPEAGADLA